METETLHHAVPAGPARDALRIALNGVRSDELVARICPRSIGMAERRRSRQASRQGQAFGWLLEEEGEPAAAGPARRRSGSGREQGRGRPVLLRDEVQQQQGPSQEGALPQLIELFGGLLPEDVISDVLQACGGSLEAAMDALLTMSAPAAAVGAAGSAREEPAAAAGESQERSGSN